MTISFSARRLRGLALALLALNVWGAAVVSVQAQTASCSRLQSSLDQLNRNADFRNAEANTRNTRELARAVQNSESAYVRNGCNDDARAGRILTPQCQGIAREVLRLRDQYAQAAASAEMGVAVAQQREAILQEMARFGCSAGSSATFPPERQTLFDRIFTSPDGYGGYGDGQMIDDNYDYWGYGGYQTVRSLCVRLTDGYFWPVSYATLPEYLSNDAIRCQQMCPGMQVDLYFHDNPGEEAEEMRNLSGQPYTALPSAFRYREVFDTESSCRPRSADGRINVATTSEGASRAMIEFGEANFPLPMRDPRRQAPVAVAAVDATAYVDVPLPRRRPGAVAAPGAGTDEAGDLRLVRFGERVVRVVGPDTPYAQAGAAGS